MPASLDLGAAEARRLSLSTLGLAAARPANVTATQLRAMVSRVHAIQIDSVNVLQRAHYLPAFSRLGPYATDTLDQLVYAKRELFEYIGHQASFIPTAMHPLFRWRMAVHDGFAELDPRDERRALADRVLAEVRERGPISASELTGGGKSSGPWWGWSAGKRMLEWHFRSGRLAVAGRRNFERLYDVPERVIPRAVLDAPTPAPDDAKKRLLELSAQALGVGTARDLANYFEVESTYSRPKIGGKRVATQLTRYVRELVEEGRLVPVRVEGWKEAAYVVPDAKVPKAAGRDALVSPFDPVLWDRRRVLRAFAFDYTIEIYVPRPKRRYGYYVLPFLQGDQFSARVDLKAVRKEGRLDVLGAWVEDDAPTTVSEVAERLAAELGLLASWLALDSIAVSQRGDLAGPLRAAIGS